MIESESDDDFTVDVLNEDGSLWVSFSLTGLDAYMFRQTAEKLGLTIPEAVEMALRDAVLENKI